LLRSLFVSTHWPPQQLLPAGQQVPMQQAPMQQVPLQQAPGQHAPLQQVSMSGEELH
jgi:hypothetical protein